MDGFFSLDLPASSPTPAPFEHFAAKRQAMNAAWSAYLATNPSAEDVADELEATRSVMAQLVALAVPHG